MPKKGYKQTEEHKRKIGITNAIILKGKHVSPETEFKPGHCVTEEIRRKLSASHMGVNTWTNGTHPTEETKRKMSEYNKNHPSNWKGGICATTNGYISMLVENGNRKLEHTLIIEQFLGRILLENEIVHHINNIKTDNRIENLQVMSRSEHIKLHMWKEKTK